MADKPENFEYSNCNAEDEAYQALLEEVATLEAENAFLKMQNQKLNEHFRKTQDQNDATY